MKKRELQALVEAQAAEIADLRRRVEALEARPTIAVTPSERVVGPEPQREPWLQPLPWEWDKIICDNRTYTVTAPDTKYQMYQ